MRCSYIALAQSRTCLWASPGSSNGEDNRDGTREITSPVDQVANHMIEDALKQRRCGPFWCLPIVHRSGLLKRHTFIAGSAVGNSHPSQGRQSEPKPGKASAHRRGKAFRGSGVSTGRLPANSLPPLSTAFMRGCAPARRSLCVRLVRRDGEDPMATQRILDFLATRRPSGPCLVVDLDVVQDNFHAFRKRSEEHTSELQSR